MSNKLTKSETIKLQIGGEATILDVLGEGGQGIVYLAEYNGKKYALKWYSKVLKTDFYDNLKKNIENGAPTKNFLWPLYLTEKKGENFGYLMEVRPDCFADLSKFLLAKVHFGSVSAMIRAATNICYSFRTLHNLGYSYQDMNDGNFFIDPRTGDVLIGDNDNVAPHGVNLGIAGKCRYMAPEVVLGKAKPSTETDRFSLAVVLFLILFNNHPLEGHRVTSTPCLTEDAERKFYGSHPVFIYDPKDNSNHPVRGIHANVIRRWSLYPQYIKEAFVKSFSQEACREPNARIIDKEWLKLLMRWRDDLTLCACGNETFASPDEETYTCIACGGNEKRPLLLNVNTHNIMLCANKKLYQSSIKDDMDDYEKMVGQITENKKYKGVLGLKNLSADTWVLTTKDGTQRSISPQDVAPLLLGNQINFGAATVGNIK